MQPEFITDTSREIVVWLVWVDDRAGRVQLRAIATAPDLAKKYSKVIREEAEISDKPRPWISIEQTRTNHLFAWKMFEEYLPENKRRRLKDD